MEIKNKMTVTRGEGDNGGRVKSRNMYKEPMDKVNRWRRIECGRWGWVAKGRVKGENEDNCN